MGKIIEIPYKPRNWSYKLHNSYKRFFSLIIHRRGGKTTSLINHLQMCAIDDARERARLRFLMPDISETLLKTLLRNRFYGIVFPTYSQAELVAWDMLKYYAKEIPGIKTNEVDLEIKYPNGGKIRLFGSDKPDRLRGPAFWGLGFDEYSQQPSNIFSEVLSKSLADHLGFAIFVGTIKGKNQLYRTHTVAKANQKEWDYIWQDIDYTLKTETDETITLLRRALEDDRKLVKQGMMTQEEFEQEWYLATDAAIKGAYYAQELAKARKDNRITKVDYDNSLPVYTVWDLGVSDAMAICFFQKYRQEMRLIDYYENRDRGLDYYARILKNKTYVYAKHIAPHDIGVRELTTGKTRLEIAKSLGIQFEVLPRLSRSDRINAGKQMFSRLWIDEKKCQVWIDYIAQYRREWDDDRGMFKDDPFHDFTSHCADSYGYAALAENMMNQDIGEILIPVNNNAIISPVIKDGYITEQEQEQEEVQDWRYL